MQTDILEKTYSKNFPVGYPQMEPNMTVKPSAILDFLQSMASEHAEKIGFGYSAMSENNHAWFLLKYRIEFVDYPSGIFNIEIITEPRGYRKLFAYRNFSITAGAKLLGKATSMWAIVNTEKGGFVAPQLIDSPYMREIEPQEDDLDFCKISLPQEFSITKDFEIRYEDIDVNEHVNNINYFIWAFETLGYDFRIAHKLKTLDVVYKKEVKYGDAITVKTAFISGDTTVHIVKNSAGEDLCHIQAVWTSI